MKYVILLSTLLLLTGCSWPQPKQEVIKAVRETVEFGRAVGEVVEEVGDTVRLPATRERPVVKDLDVPFMAQAPTGNWDEAHQELCEEASLVMVKYFVMREKLTPAKAEEEYIKLKTWQIEKFGSWLDTDGEQTARIARELYRLDVEVVRGEAVTIERLERELAAGHPVIVPLYGKALPNPNFRNVSDYHMIVLRGYDSDEFITNDNGTTRGARWKYSKEKVWAAIHDYNGGNAQQGPKAILVIKGVLTGQ